MAETPLANVADAILRRAQRQGYVVPRDVRAELSAAGLAEDQWKDVVALLKNELHYRQGRYHHMAAVSPRQHQELEQQRAIAKVIKSLIKEHKDAVKERERRGQIRVDFIHPVKVQTEDGKEMLLMCRDISTTGIRLIGTQRLLGHKVKITISPKTSAAVTMIVRILWTCAVGDDLYENGGNFLEMVRS